MIITLLSQIDSFIKLTQSYSMFIIVYTTYIVYTFYASITYTTSKNSTTQYTLLIR